ncbi:hypothetical protein AYO20_09377 [Fonsecaea nubica]|uniref:Protein kinase domain-containing protein n=1 Tax=Fonsecaea nubica TaxID=856822 RepID=A0A178CHZ1_9EURO|nr:hypothetical protein AYO20_09377 [Fonsecaea nubica]OAL28653.1 hypothetical protein AYO20_09377 [Fonsecaea nubica]
MTAYGMTGYVRRLDEDRVVKVAKTYSLDHHVGTPAFDDTECINEVNRKTLENEVAIYRRLVAFAKQGDLEDYIKSAPEPPGPLKVDWILSIIDAFSYIHSRRVLVDDIALRNILVSDGQLKLADLGQSILLLMSTSMDTVCHREPFLSDRCWRG